MQLSVAGPHSRPSHAAALPCRVQQAPVPFRQTCPVWQQTPWQVVFPSGHRQRLAVQVKPLLHASGPQLTVPPQTLVMEPQSAFAGQMLLVQPQTLAVPGLPPPQVFGALQVPQSIGVPQLLAIWSQLFVPHGSTGVQHDPVPFWQTCPL